MKIDHYDNFVQWARALDHLYGENPYFHMTTPESGVFMVDIAGARVAVWDNSLNEGSIVNVDGQPLTRSPSGSHPQQQGYKTHRYDD